MTRLVYILAASHSGSTLLSMLLGAHPEACTVGELKLSPSAMGNTRDYPCSCGELVPRCVFWRCVREEMRKEGISFDLSDAQMDFRRVESPYANRLSRVLYRGPVVESLRDMALALSPMWRRRYPQLQNNNATFVKCVLRILGKQVIVDSSKIALRLKYLLRNKAFDVKVIRLIRDGRGVSLTYMAPSRFAAAQDPILQRRHEATGVSMAKAAGSWRRSTEEADRILRRLDKSQWIDIRYEELCDEPEEMLQRLCEFIGVDPTTMNSDFRAVEQHVLGNDMRLDRTVAIELDNRWRDVLNAQDLQTFDRIAGRLNREYGYD